MSEMNYREDIAIDPDQLDVACLEQPSMVFDYNEEYARAKRRAERAKANIDLVKAQCIADIRENFKEYGMAKYSETGAKSMAETMEEYIEAQEEYQEARYEQDVLSAAVKAFDHRKSMLQELVQLHGASYFAGPSVPRELSKEWAKGKTRDSARESVKSRMKRKGKDE